MAAEKEKRKADFFFFFLAVCVVTIASYIYQRTQSDVKLNSHIHVGDMAAPWKEWSQTEIDRQMSPSQWSPRMDAEAVINAHCSVLRSGTEAAYSMANMERRVAYGKGEDEVVDLFLPLQTRQLKAVVAYIHGGMWQFLSAADSGFLAPPLIEQGEAVVAAVEYTIAPKGSMAGMVSQCERAIAFLHQRFPTLPLIVIGHSAGGHLAAMLQWTEWAALGAPKVADQLQAIFAVSPLTELEPVRLSYANEALKLTPEDVTVFSPVRLALSHPAPRLQINLFVVYGTHETDEFKRQAHAYATAMRDLTSCREVQLQRDHFEIIENLADPRDDLTLLVLEEIRRTKPVSE